MGFLDDKVGGRLTIKVTLIGLMIAIVLAVYAPEFRSWLQYLLGGSAVPDWVNGKNIFGLLQSLLVFFRVLIKRQVDL